ncbi:MAG TPA: hypothetical protein VKR43_18000 [Bryobacteraceae bacterium]|nr:hypothetical protein [Bryobacteraceae bacterium]
MNRWRWHTLLLCGVLLVPLVVYHNSYRGYFGDDDLGSINWARLIPLKSYLTDLPALDYPCRHSRPTGYFYYGALWKWAGFHYAPWALTLLALGLVNVALLWLLLRKMGLGDIESAVGCLCFACGRAALDAWWQPMFVYDVLCTLFALAMLVAYAYRRWVLSFVALWLAIRSKEIGIVLPAVLLAYEMTVGEGKWKRVIPYFVPAAIYGAYGLRYNLSLPHISYSLGVGDLWKAVAFYSGKILGISYLGLALPLLVLVRDRRMYFALAAVGLDLGVYLLLPGRMLEVYVYLAMTAVAIAIAVMAARYRRVVVMLAAGWVVWQVTLDRKQVRVALAEAEERRVFTDLVRNAPDARVYAYVDAPGSFGYRGGEHAIRVTHDHMDHGVDQIYRIEDPGLRADTPVELLRFDWKARRLEAGPVRLDQFAFFERPARLADWQAGSQREWAADTDGFREVIEDRAVRAYRPGTAREFVVEACGTERSVLHIGFEATHFPTMVFRDAGCETRVEKFEAGAGQVVSIFFAIESSQHPVKIGSFGFK